MELSVSTSRDGDSDDDNDNEIRDYIRLMRPVDAWNKGEVNLTILEFTKLNPRFPKWIIRKVVSCNTPECNHIFNKDMSIYDSKCNNTREIKHSSEFFKISKVFVELHYFEMWENHPRFILISKSSSFEKKFGWD